MNYAFERNILGEPAVYPGHPVTIALLITHAFSSLDEATSIGKRFPQALESNDIPGAGGNVWYALDLLKLLHSGMPWDIAIGWADRAWADCDGQGNANVPRWTKGQAQADRVKPLLAARAAWWQANS